MDGTFLHAHDRARGVQIGPSGGIEADGDSRVEIHGKVLSSEIHGHAFLRVRGDGWFVEAYAEPRIDADGRGQIVMQEDARAVVGRDVVVDLDAPHDGSRVRER
jgi:hypothetical protein